MPSADIPETCTVIVSLDGKSLSERAGGELVSEYITTDAGKDAVRAIESEQASFLASLKKAAISYELVGSYNAVMNGVALNVRTAQLTQIKALGGVSTVSVSQTYAVPQEEEGASSSSDAQTNYSNIYENGIYNSSDLVAEGYDGSGMTVAILDTGLDYTHEAFLNMPAEVSFTKEYVDKYNIPYQDIHTLEDLEPYLKLIKENEPDVVPMYLTKDYTAPTYMDKIQDPVGIEYGDDTLTVKNVFETERMKSTLDTMRKYYLAGYINKDAATASDDKSIKRFVTKGDGQPYAELTWGKDLGYEVVATQIMDTQITNASARGALTAINKNSEHPEKAMELLNLINTDQELRNMLNYGIEGVHWEKVESTQEEKDAAAGKDYIYDYKAKLNPEKQKDYSAPYWVQGGLFNTYVMDNEPLDKWATFKEFNDASQEAPSFGFDFDLEPVSTQVAGFRNVLDEFGKSLYTGSVDPEEYLPQLQKKLEATGIQDVIDEMQRQIDEWKAAK